MLSDTYDCENLTANRMNMQVKLIVTKMLSLQHVHSCFVERLCKLYVLLKASANYISFQHFTACYNLFWLVMRLDDAFCLLYLVIGSSLLY